MPKFLILYRSSVGAREQMAGASPEQVEAGMTAIACSRMVAASVSVAAATVLGPM